VKFLESRILVQKTETFAPIAGLERFEKLGIEIPGQAGDDGGVVIVKAGDDSGGNGSGWHRRRGLVLVAEDGTGLDGFVEVVGVDEGLAFDLQDGDLALLGEAVESGGTNV